MQKVEGMGMVRRTSSVPGLARRSTAAEMGLTPEQAAIIERMRAAQDSCGGWLDTSKKYASTNRMHESCFLCKRFAQLSSLSLHVLFPLPLTVASSFTRRTMEATSAVLWEHFKKIPQDKLQAHIILRFNGYDTDHSGSLDRTEMREAMAEMGRRPSETELDDLMAIADKDGDGTINLDEFSLYIFQQIGVKDSKKSKEIRKAETVKKFGRSPSAPAEFERLPSTDSASSGKI
jgi:hypothetical protein